MSDMPSMTVQADANTISLKEYIDTRLHALEDKQDIRLAALEKLIQAAISAQAIAITKAETATEHRLASMNEFRKTVEDQSTKQATKIELEALRSTLIANIDTVRVEASARSEANRIASDIEAKSIWKVLYGLATAVAVIQAFIQFSPVK